MTVNLAVVGLGYWGPSLARSAASIPGARLHAVCDSRRDRLDAAARDYPAAKPYADLRALLEDPEVQGVVLSTPVSTHFDMAREALRAGRHVLVEKPLARTAAECRDLAALAAERKRILMGGHVFLYNPAVRRIREYIDSGELGRVHYAVSQRLNLGIVRQDVNALWNLGPHDVSILNYWMRAAPVGVTVRGYSYVQAGIEDVVFMSLDYPDGVGANVHLSWLDPRKVRSMTVVGDRKMVVFDDVNPDARVVLYDKGIRKATREGDSPLGTHRDFAEFQLLLRAGDVVIPKIDFAEPLRLELMHFVDCIATGKTPLTDAEESLRVVRTLEAAQRSLQDKGRWTEVEP